MASSDPTIRNSAKALIVRDGSIVLQQCRINGQLVYLLPGGTQQFGESLQQALRREVLEETGMIIRAERLLWVREFIMRNHLQVEDHGDHVVEHIFECDIDVNAEIGNGATPDTAQIAVRWILLNELQSITMWPEAVKALLLMRSQGSAVRGPVYLGDCL